MKKGRQCNECHGAKNVKQAHKDNKLTLTWLEDGKVKNLKGVVPVVDGLKYECVHQDLKDGKWVPIKNPLEPKIQFAAFGKPLTKEQFDALAEPQEVPEVTMEPPKPAK